MAIEITTFPVICNLLAIHTIGERDLLVVLEPRFSITIKITTIFYIQPKHPILPSRLADIYPLFLSQTSQVAWRLFTSSSTSPSWLAHTSCILLFLSTNPIDKQIMIRLDQWNRKFSIWDLDVNRKDVIKERWAYKILLQISTHFERKAQMTSVFSGNACGGPWHYVKPWKVSSCLYLASVL